ncbi:MAG: DEAD/DEAH box helicase [Candidatus Helarchaeota archaeon]
MDDNRLHKKYLKVPEWFKENLAFDYLLPNQSAFCIEWFDIKEFKDTNFEYYNESGLRKKVKVRKFGPNYFIVSGTGTGKSLIAHIAMISTLTEKGGLVIYSGNYKALINEQYDEISELINGQKFKIKRKTGDFTSTGVEDLGYFDIILTTYESCEQILQNRPKWLHKVNLIVIDEVHTIGDEGRGPILESVIAMALSLKIPLIFLSATVGDEEDIESFAKNLNATLIDAHDFRLIPLDKFILTENEAYFNNGKKCVKIVKSTGRFENTSSSIGAMRNFALWVLFSQAKKAIEENAREPQILLFVRSRKDAEDNCKRLVKRIKELLEMPSIKKNFNFKPFKLDDVKELSPPSTNVMLSDILKETIPYRVAFHSSNLTLEWRNYVEKMFKLGYIRAIWSTPTLSAGVNLPAQYTLIYPKIGIRDLRINEYNQSIGRAGRPKYDKIGYGGIVMINRNELTTKEENLRWYLTKYLNAPTDAIYSSMIRIEDRELNNLKQENVKINGNLMLIYYNQRLLRTHPNFFAFILKLISANYATNKHKIIDFCKKYLFIFKQFPELPVSNLIDEAIQVLLDPYRVVPGEYFGKILYKKALGNSFPLIDELPENSNSYSVRPLGELSIKTYLRPLSASIYASLSTNREINHRLFYNKNEDVIASKLLYFIGLAPDFQAQFSIPSSILISLINEYNNYISDDGFILNSDFIQIDSDECYNYKSYPSLYSLSKSVDHLQIKSFLSWWVSLITNEWINETPLRKIEEKFNISIGSYQNFFGQNGVYAWLLQASALIAMHYKNKILYKKLLLLSRRIEKGCKLDILPLTYLKNVGRDRARQLWNLGFKTIESVAEASPEAIAKVKGLSLNLATDVIAQAKRIVSIREKNKRKN